MCTAITCRKLEAATTKNFFDQLIDGSCLFVCRCSSSLIPIALPAKVLDYMFYSCFDCFALLARLGWLVFLVVCLFVCWFDSKNWRSVCLWYMMTGNRCIWLLNCNYIKSYRTHTQNNSNQIDRFQSHRIQNRSKNWMKLNGNPISNDLLWNFTILYL